MQVLYSHFHVYCTAPCICGDSGGDEGIGDGEATIVLCFYLCLFWARNFVFHMPCFMDEILGIRAGTVMQMTLDLVI